MFEYWLSKVLHQHGIGYWWQLKPQVTKHLWWWPQGRDVTRTEFPGLGFTGALLYPIAKTLGLRMVDWVGIIPAFYGALTVLGVALLGWIIGGPYLALLMAVAVGFQYAFMQRSIASFVEKMSPTTFFSSLMLTTFALVIKEYIKKGKAERSAALWGLIGGLAMSLSSAFWGGYLAFIGVLAIALALFPFIKPEQELSRAALVYSLTLLLGFLVTSWWITTIWSNKVGMATVVAMLIMVIETSVTFALLKFYEKEKGVKVWTALIVMAIIVILLVASFTQVLHKMIGARYLMMIMPWLRHIESPLARSVAEHQGILNVISPNIFPQVFGVGSLAPLALLLAIVYIIRKEKLEEVLMTLPLVAVALFATYLVSFNTSVYLMTLIGFMLAIGGALSVYWLSEDLKRMRGIEKIVALALLLLALLLYCLVL
jgi:asparagine N-glycosylation enzyme membrane subunit Stt3